MQSRYRGFWVNLWQLHWPLCRRVIQVASFLLLCFGSVEIARADRGDLDFSLGSLPSSKPASQILVADKPSPQAADSFTESGKLNRKLNRATTLSFDLPRPGIDKVASPQKAAPPEPLIPDQPSIAAAPAIQIDPAQYEMAELFQGGSHSLVAKAVGTAEGTRTPNGGKTWAYYGHLDPGNGVWNLGSFSYQHGAKTLEEADQKQLRRLERQAQELRRQAAAQGMTLTLEEELNGIDLANQAPLAALDTGGYIDWLKEAHKAGMRGSEAVLWARTRSFINPHTGTWNAPGLGNNFYSISSDQKRRLKAIAKAIESNQTQHLDAHIRPRTPTPSPDAQADVAATTPPPPPSQEAIADHIIFHEFNPPPADPGHTVPAQTEVLAAPGLQPTPSAKTTSQERIAAQIIGQDLSEAPISQPAPQAQSSSTRDSSTPPPVEKPPKDSDVILQIP